MTKRFIAAALGVMSAACATNGTSAGVGKVSQGGVRTDPAFLIADIKNKDAAALDALLGAPDLARVEGEGEFRRYMLSDCALIVILFPDNEGTKRAAQIDAGALVSGAEKPDVDACLARGKTPVSLTPAN